MASTVLWRDAAERLALYFYIPTHPFGIYNIGVPACGRILRFGAIIEVVNKPDARPQDNLVLEIEARPRRLLLHTPAFPRQGKPPPVSDWCFR